jgi:hypothetical protein
MSPRPESECLPEAELVELFRPRRTDPEAFRRGVQRHIDARSDAGGGRDGTHGASADADKDDAGESTWLRRVAAFLPDPMLGALSGSAVGKLAGAKLFPAALAIPVLLLGTALGAFAASARSLQRSASQAKPIELTRRRHGMGLPVNRELGLGSVFITALQLGGLILMLAAPLVGGIWAIDTIFVLLLVSMAALVISIRGFARAGWFARSEVAHLCAGVLLSLFMGCFLWMGSFHVADPHSELGIGWSVAVVLLGIPLCLAYSSAMLSLLAVLAWFLCLFALNPLGWTRTSPDALREQIARIELEPLDLSNWRQVAALQRALELTGHEPADLSSVERELEAALEAADADSRKWTAGVDVHPQVWTSALQMGLIDAEHRALLAQRDLNPFKLKQLRAEIELHLVESDEYAFWLLRDEPGLSAATRTSIAARLEATWPEVGKHGALADALLCVRGLELLGFPERAEALRERARHLLVAHWVPSSPVSGRSGGFTPNPLQFRTSMDDSTWHAVQLMQRYGVPPEIDTRFLRGHLRSESRVRLMDRKPELQAHSRAALLVLEEGIGLPPRSVVQRVLDERLLLASVLLVVLCLLAIRLAPAIGERAGAQP